MNRYKNIVFVVAIAFVSACGSVGGTEAGNPTDVPTQKMVGLFAMPCPADTVVAVDSRAVLHDAAITAVCSFELDLAVDTAYRINLSKFGETFATMVFQNGPSLLSSPVMFLSRGDDPIDLGFISIADDTAAPGAEPSTQTDRDGDGLHDFDDMDDDEDGIADMQEEDCDLDGFFDDDDEDATCLSEDNGATVLEVRPLSNEGIADGTEPVKSNEDIWARTSCVLDIGSVTPSTFNVQSSLGSIDCDFSFPGDDERFVCEHNATNFVAGVMYTATLNGVRCADGRPLNPIKWSWKSGKRR